LFGLGVIGKSSSSAGAETTVVVTVEAAVFGACEGPKRRRIDIGDSGESRSALMMLAI
jgi:hypothetical protein